MKYHFNNKTYHFKILYLLLALLPFIYIDNIYNKTELPRYAFLSFSVILAYIFFLAQYKTSRTLYWNNNIGVFLLFISFALISINWSVSYGLYTENSIKLLTLSFIFLLASQINKIETIKTLFYVCVLASFIVSSIGILQKFNINPFGFIQLAPPSSSFINRNFASNYLDLVIPINLILLILSSSRKETWLLTISLSFNISYVLIIVSKGSWLSLIIVFILFLIASNQLDFLKEKLKAFSSKNKAPLLILFIIPIILFSLPGKNGKVLEKQDTATTFSPYKTTSSGIRINSYLTSFDMILEKPLLGVGLGNFHTAFQAYKRASDSKHKVNTNLLRLHNDFLQLVVELGFIGGGLFLLFLLLTLTAVIKLLRQQTTSSFQLNENNTSKKFISLALILSLASSFTHSLFSFPMHQANTSFIIFLWLGCLTALYSKKITNSICSKYLLYIFIFVIVLFSFLAIPHYKNSLSSSYHINSAINYFEQKDCDNAISQSEIAIKYFAKDYYSQSWAITIFSDCRVKNVSQIESLTNTILNNNPLHPYALKMSARNYYQQQKYSLAEKPLFLLTHLFPSIPATYIELGHAFYKQNKFLDAKNEYLKALRFDKKNPLAIKSLKMTNLKIKDLRIRVP